MDLVGFHSVHTGIRSLMALMGLMALMALMALMDLRERESVEARLMSPTRQRLQHWQKPVTSSWPRLPV
jgi:hypothetical protein